MTDLFTTLEPFKAEIGAPFGHSEQIPDGYGMTLDEAKTLYALVRRFDIKKVLEMGTHMGNSTWYLAQALKKNHPPASGELFLITVDTLQRSNSRIVGTPNVLAVQMEALQWMRQNNLAQFDFFNHDDDHKKSHIENEMELIWPHHPKIVTIHDSRAESKEFWDMVMNRPEYMPDYERYELPTGMGMGILIRKALL
jgi:predicted O-methyltransferase YrrM